MNILHISNGFAGSKVHSNLTKALDELGVQQTVYCPVREERLLGGNQFDGKRIKFEYSFCIKSWYKYVYHFKEHKLYKDLKKHVDLSQVDIIHAHTLFSDGGLAYKAYKEYGTKYIVTIRNTDLNDYIRLMKHTYWYGRKILLHAEKIYFISVGIMRQFEKSEFTRPIIKEIKDKFEVLPNGIDDYWHEHISRDDRKGNDILYIGDFSPNKNVVRLAKAVINLRNSPEYNNLRLTIVGGEIKGAARKTDNGTQEMIDKYPEAINALGKIYDKSKLSEVMRGCTMFAMPSIFETFGLVYLEALSQNLPVIYTKGQGIDGLFDETVGVGVNPLSVEDIQKAIKLILDNRDKYSNRNVRFEDFKWANIAKKYIIHYKEILNQNNA